MNDFCGGSYFGKSLNRHTRKHFRFVNIRSDQRSLRAKLGLKSRYRIIFKEYMSTFGHHNRIHDKMLNVLRSQFIAYRRDNLWCGQHAGFDGPDWDVRKNRIKLFFNDRGGEVKDR